jgi:thiol-disulfide isomerase/thioredoxin
MKQRHAFPLFLISLFFSLFLAGPANAASYKAAQDHEFDLSAYRGKVVYLDFWASWCGPCRASFPFMNDLVARYGDKLAVVTVNLDEDRDSADEFIDEFHPLFPVFFDPKGKQASKYGVSGMPNSFLFDRDGKLILKHMGFTKKDPATLEQKITAALSH